MKSKGNKDISGILIIDKPEGMTSFGVDSAVKKKLNIAKVGHAGTLDPFATGVLPVLLNKATKLQNELINIPKSYEGTFRLGISTNTLDVTGTQLDSSEVSDSEVEKIAAYLDTLKGDFVQKIPAFSARKLNGIPLYKYARKNETVVLDNPTAVVSIYDFQVKSFKNPYIDFKCTVSKGTYVRAMAQDIMDKFNMPAHLFSLKRISAGGFDISEAVAFEVLDNYNIIINKLKTNVFSRGSI